jgi:PHS family inorganic phosphate transporter-like MFS transporter
LDASQSHSNVHPGGFLALYCFANFFANFGPNTTTFIIPGEAFPTRYRSTSHGISAASGKFGAIIAQVIIFKLSSNSANNNDHDDPGSVWVRILLGIFAAFMFSGVISTWLLIPETNGRTLEDISNEDQRNFVKSSDTSSRRTNLIPRAPEHPPFSSNPWTRSIL